MARRMLRQWGMPMQVDGMVWRKPDKMTWPYECGVYMLTSTSGKTYVGGSRCLRKRLATHKNYWARGKHTHEIQKEVDNGNVLSYRLLIACRPSELALYDG